MVHLSVGCHQPVGCSSVCRLDSGEILGDSCVGEGPFDSQV